MKVVRGRNPELPVQVMTPTFTGSVLGDVLVPATDGVAVVSVLFTPGARTWWHRHENGQVLHVTGGAGWVGSRSEVPSAVRAGDTVWTAPGEEHWHGAGPDSYLHHLAVSLGETEWQEEVSDEDYRRGSSAPPVT